MFNTANGNQGPEMASATRENNLWHRWIGLFAGLALATVGAQVAHAEVSAEVALTSDYVWRGVSQTNQNPALQAGPSTPTRTGVYVGVWGSMWTSPRTWTIRRASSSTTPSAWRGETAPGLGWDLSLLRYTYPKSTEDFDYNEVTLSLSYEMFTL